MKILLIYPYSLEERLSEDDIRVVPIGLYYVAAMLQENHHDVDILNGYNINKTPEKIRETLIQKNPDVIGFSILHANRWGGIEIARIAKQINPAVKIVFGGIGATFLWRHFLTHFQEIDYVVMGEGEYTFLNLIKWMESKSAGSLAALQGIAYRKTEGDVVQTGPAQAIQDLDALPNPAVYYDYQHLSASRGCPENCTFCGSPRFWGRKLRFHSPEYVVNQLELLYHKGRTFFYFSDDTFTLQKGYVIEICRKILERNLKIAWVAISNVKAISEDILCWMRKAGCIQISYGVESGSTKIRRLLNKHTTNRQIEKAFSLTRKYGILPRAYFIYGSPEETWETIQETIDLMNRIKPLSAIFYILDIFPGTALYSAFMERQHLTDDIWLNRIEDIMYFETDERLTGQLILDFGEKLRSSFYENLPRYVDSIELVDAEGFSEWHADFLSRIAMTFSHGDYARVEAIQGKDRIAEGLYRRSLGYHPNARAYLGLGMLKQKQNAFRESARILFKGIERFPENESLHICQGINYMKMGEFEKALSCFLPFKESKETFYYIATCYQALGDTETSSRYYQKYQSMNPQRRVPL